MSDYSDLYQAVVADPDNDQPRLALAEWLDNQGNPWGEYIRSQCRSFKLQPHHPGYWREVKIQAELRKQHQAEWFGEAAGDIQATRGFPSFVSLKDPFTDKLLLLDQYPTIDGAMIISQEFSEEALRNSGLPERSIQMMATSPQRPQPPSATQASIVSAKLISLSDRFASLSVMYPNHFPELRDSLLTAQGGWPRLMHMGLNPLGWNAELTRAVFQSPRLETLEVLTLAELPADEASLRVYRSLPPTKLRSLTITDTEAAAFESLSADGTLARIEHLVVTKSDAAAFASLDHGETLPRLKTFCFYGKQSEDISTVLSWHIKSPLATLRFPFQVIPADFFAALGRSTYRNLELIEVKPELKHAASLREFLSSDFARDLTVQLSNVDGRLIAAVASTPLAPCARLHLSIKLADDVALRGILDGDWASRIRVLNAWGGRATPAILEELLSRNDLEALESINVSVVAEQVPTSLLNDFRSRFGSESIKPIPLRVMQYREAQASDDQEA